MNSIKEDDYSNLRIYRVEVQQQGKSIAFYQVEAIDALTAINWVERHYGEPVILEETDIQDEAGQDHHVTLARNWHGYMFHARVVHPSPEVRLDWQPEAGHLFQSGELLQVPG